MARNRTSAADTVVGARPPRGSRWYDAGSVSATSGTHGRNGAGRWTAYAIGRDMRWAMCHPYVFRLGGGRRGGGSADSRLIPVDPVGLTPPRVEERGSIWRRSPAVRLPERLRHIGAHSGSILRSQVSADAHKQVVKRLK